MTLFKSIFPRDGLFARLYSFCPFPFFFLLAFVTWVYCYWGFFCGKLSLTSDAIAYYEHFKFYLDQMSRGVYPLWDPTRDWGGPTEFFLRRNGSFNPFIFLPLLFNKLGLNFTDSYLAFLSVYFFSGMVAFYLICRRTIGDPLVCFAAFLLLLLSSLTTRLFDSYIMLTAIPMMWFFYFFISFMQAPRRFSFLGCTLTLMILLTTYIPFYFAIILFTFLFWQGVIYFKEFKAYAIRLKNFLLSHKFLTLICVASIGLSLIPGLQFKQEGGKGDFVMPARHGGGAAGEVAVDNQMGVSLQTVTGWGIEEELTYGTAFNDLRKFKFAIVYFSIFIYIVFFLGLGVPLNKRILFLFFWGLTLLLMFSHRGPIYRVLYDHLFFFKYFRNLHFFVWFVLMPIFVALMAEQWRAILASKKQLKGSWFFWLVVCALHFGLLFYVYNQGYAIWSTYASIVLSFLFYVVYFIWRNRQSAQEFTARGYPFVLWALVFAAIALQPMQVFSYLQKNTPLVDEMGYRYDMPYLSSLHFKWRNYHVDEPIDYQKFLKDIENERGQILAGPNIYMALSWFYDFRKYIHPKIAHYYLSNQMRAYDAIEWIPTKITDYQRIEKAFAEAENVAFITADKPQPELAASLVKDSSLAQVITRSNPEVELLEYDINHFTLKTNFPKPKFLVFNDNYHDNWSAKIDGQPMKIWRANISFKGFFVPAGEHTISFVYGTKGQYLLNYSLFIIFQIIFLSFIGYAFVELRKK